MATRQGDTKAIIKRIEALEPMGWRIEQAGAGNHGGKGNLGEYRVWSPHTDERTFSIHQTYSDRNSITALLRELNKYGLSKDEAKMKSNKLRENAEKLKAEREAAEQKAQEMAANNTARLQKAAGPYQTTIDECDIAWLTTPHPAPWHRTMYITPKVAAHLLEHHNPRNRKLSEQQAMRYAKMMLAGRWLLTHQGIAIDTNGDLLDAQHRMRAVVLAGELNDQRKENGSPDAVPDIKIPFRIHAGEPTVNFKAIDEGRLRTAAQMLNMVGAPNPLKLQTVIKAILAYDSDNPRSKGEKLTQAVANEMWEADPEGLRESMAVGDRAYRHSGKVLTDSHVSTAHYLICRANGRNNVYVKAFFEGLIANRKWRTAYVLPDDDPRATLITRYKGGKPVPIEGVFWIITAWNNFARGYHPRILKFNHNNAIPRILLCRPGDGQPPRALYGELYGLDEEGNEIGDDE